MADQSQPLDPEIARLLRQLQSDRADERKVAAERLGVLGISSAEIFDSLRRAAATDPNKDSAFAARTALIQLGGDAAIVSDPKPREAARQAPVESTSAPATSCAGRWKPHAYKSPRERALDVAVGFFGWFVGAAIFWLILSRGYPGIMEWASPCSGSGCGMGFAFAFLFCTLPINVAVLVVLLWLRTWIALGAVLAFVANFVIASGLQLYYAPMLGVPFFLLLQP